MPSVKKLDYQTGFSELTHANIAAFLKRTLTASEQTLVTSLIAEVERDLCRSCSRQFSDTAEIVEEFGSGFNKFDLYNLPIASIVKIEVDGVDVTANYTEGEDYWIIDELYVRFETPIVSQNLYTGVKITYTIRKFWGSDILLLLKKWVSYEFLNSENAGVGVNNFSFADLSKTFNVAQFEKEKQKLISYYEMHQL